VSCDARLTKGKKVDVCYQRGKPATTFIAGGCERLEVDEYLTVVNGKVKLADGTVCNALLEIDETSSGEHCGTGIFFTEPDGACNITFQGDENFLTPLGKTKEQVYPYKYRYEPGLVHCYDHHIDEETGWSIF